MKTIKNNYTNFILTVIAVAMIGILFKGNIITAAHAWSFDLSDFELESRYDDKRMVEYHHKTGYLIKQICGG